MSDEINNEMLTCYNALSKYSFNDIRIAIGFLVEHGVENAGLELAQKIGEEVELVEIDLNKKETFGARYVAYLHYYQLFKLGEVNGNNK